MAILRGFYCVVGVIGPEIQGIAEAVLDAECKIGALMDDVDKASGGDHGNQYTGGKTVGTQHFGKVETLKESGFSEHQQKQFQQLAKNTDYVETAKECYLNSGNTKKRDQILTPI